MPEKGRVYHTKGSHLVQAEAWIDARLGAGTFKRLLAEASGEPVGLLLPGHWYDVEPLHRVLQKVSERVGQSVEDITMGIARENALHDLTSIYRIFLRIVNPVRLLGQTPRLWSTYCDFGHAEAVVNDAGHYEAEGSGFPMHLLDWVCGGWRGFIPAAIELAGGKDVVGKILSRGAGVGGEGRLRLEARYRM
jgi:hypothetical protein